MIRKRPPGREPHSHSPSPYRALAQSEHMPSLSLSVRLGSQGLSTFGQQREWLGFWNFTYCIWTQTLTHYFGILILSLQRPYHVVISFHPWDDSGKWETLFPLNGGGSSEKLGDGPSIICLVSGETRPGTQRLWLPMFLLLPRRFIFLPRKSSLVFMNLWKVKVKEKR